MTVAPRPVNQALVLARGTSLRICWKTGASGKCPRVRPCLQLHVEGCAVRAGGHPLLRGPGLKAANTGACQLGPRGLWGMDAEELCGWDPGAPRGVDGEDLYSWDPRTPWGVDAGDLCGWDPGGLRGVDAKDPVQLGPQDPTGCGRRRPVQLGPWGPAGCGR